MSEIDTISITVNGPTGSGKSAVMEEIRRMLSDYYGYACVHMAPEHRNGGVVGFTDSESWERPRKGRTVFCLIEENVSRK